MKDLGPIILVEDPFIRSYLRFVLIRRGYSVIESDAARACEMVIADGSVLVITNTPEAFLPCAHKVALIYVATAPDMDLASQFPACRVLRKPFQPEELVKAVEGLASGE
jgi:hypothetical protein